jgi:hypothetical protein
MPNRAPFGPPTAQEQFDILNQMKDFVNLNLSELQLAHSRRSLGAVSWLARNLLELSIWSEYCAASKENAREFFLDSARDAHDALSVPDGPWLKRSLEPDHQQLAANAADDGFNIKQPYEKVRRIAEKLGRVDPFMHFNKWLSKYAHPTALAIFTDDSYAQDRLRETFYQLGLTLADGALRFLNGANRSAPQPEGPK